MGNARLFMYAGHRALAVDTEQYLPNDDDTDVATWAKRVTDALGVGFQLMVPNFESTSPVLSQRVHDFCTGLYPAWVTSARKPTSTSSFRTRKRRRSVFTKTTPMDLRSWSAATKACVFGRRVSKSKAGRSIKVCKTSLKYDDMIDGSVMLEGAPGDVLYWPRDYWHIAETKSRDLTVSLNIGVETDDLELTFFRMARAAFLMRLGEAFDDIEASDFGPSVPAAGA